MPYFFLNPISNAKGLIAPALLVLLAGCSTFDPKETAQIDCTATQSSCHSGRFGLVWKTRLADGQMEGDSVSGSYEWKSGMGGNLKNQEIAFLEVSSTLGPSIGNAKRQGDFYEVRAADGRVYLAQDWQSLFDLMFPVKLPADALVQWMSNPNAVNLPQLPQYWHWEVLEDKYRLVFIEGNTSGRIDLLPQK